MRAHPRARPPPHLPARSPQLCRECDPTGRVCFACMAPHTMIKGVCRRCFVSARACAATS